MFATGIECSYPTINHGRTRRDQLKECGHYEYWKTDLRLVQEIGLKVLRYGLPYYKIHKAPGKFDWKFADEVMTEIQRLNITPILDLLHFGVPNWIENFQNPEFPFLFAEYAGEVAKRYPWVRFYTPVNEIYVTARMSAKDGLWNEQLKTDKGFVTAIKHLVAAQYFGDAQNRRTASRLRYRPSRIRRIYARSARRAVAKKLFWRTSRDLSRSTFYTRISRKRTSVFI